MIDIHSHILPAIDDGPDSLKDALHMARLAVRDGTEHIFCTPHHHWSRFGRSEMLRRVEALQKDINKYDLKLQLHIGHEVHLFAETWQDLEKNLVHSLGDSPYILAEPLFHHYGEDTDALLNELFDRGYTPIMAHPERIIPLQGHLQKIEWFLERGGLTQLTAKSLYPEADNDVRHTSREMVMNGMPTSSLAICTTPATVPSLSRARRIASSWVGEAKAWQMVRDTPAKILERLGQKVS
ncbi:MAG: CpsB/CapC family capsule biosynthesis tyrosine phosphatase [Deinococcales bacterium]